MNQTQYRQLEGLIFKLSGVMSFVLLGILIVMSLLDPAYGRIVFGVCVVLLALALGLILFVDRRSSQNGA